MKLNANILGTRNFEEAGGLIAVKGQLGVAEIMHKQNLVLAGKGNNLFKEVARCNSRRRVVGIVEIKNAGFAGNVGRNF